MAYSTCCAAASEVIGQPGGHMDVEPAENNLALDQADGAVP